MLLWAKGDFKESVWKDYRSCKTRISIMLIVFYNAFCFQTRQWSECRFGPLYYFYCMLIYLLLYSLVSCIYLESIPDCDDISILYVRKLKNYMEVIVPYYLLSCYSAPHATSLQDLAIEEPIYILHKIDVFFETQAHKVASMNHQQSPAFFTCQSFFYSRISPFVQMECMIHL